MHVAAAQTSEPVYRGKQIRMVIGNTVGSSYDTYARVLAQHMTRHIPGNPTIINQNMPVGCEHAGDQLGFRAGAEGRHGHRRRLQFGPARAALRQSRRSLRSTQIRICRQHLQAAEHLRHVAHASGQDARAGEVAAGDRHGIRQRQRFRNPAEDSQRGARHEIQGRSGLCHAAGAPRDRKRRSGWCVRMVVVDTQDHGTGMDPAAPTESFCADRRQAAGRSAGRAARDRAGRPIPTTGRRSNFCRSSRRWAGRSSCHPERPLTWSRSCAAHSTTP